MTAVATGFADDEGDREWFLHLLASLAARDPDSAAVARLRVIEGLTLTQIADALNVSQRTAARRWAFAQGWLAHQPRPTRDRARSQFAQHYDQLREIASKLVDRQSSTTDLDPSGLVAEAYVRLYGQATPAFADHEHFIAVVTGLMRQCLIDRARRRRRPR